MDNANKRVLVPLRVRIGLNPDGTHQFPPFNILDPAVRGKMDWSQFVDRYGLGWHYDHLCGFGEADDFNPDPNSWIGVVVIPKDFADAAVAQFPNECAILTEETFEQFYDDRAHCNEETEHLDTEILQGIVARMQLEKDLGIEPSEEIKELRKRVLNPADPTPGVHLNHKRRWKTFKERTGTAIHHSCCKHRPGGPSEHDHGKCAGFQKRGNLVVGEASIVAKVSGKS